ncbi:MAG: sulfotransferase [Acidobacteria bacterium]|nr:sulfotransferase [Acidobacteriota bacterium]
MTRPLRPSDVVVGLLTENTTRMLAQAIRLLRSIRWFGGELAKSRIVVCGVGPLEPTAQQTLEDLGAEVRTVARFHPANPTGNRHSLIAELLDAPEDVLFLIDCDTIVMQDPLPYLNADAFLAKIASTPTVNDEVFDRLFGHFGIAKPPLSYVNAWSGTPTIPYFNAGLFSIPTRLARVLAPVWCEYNRIFADKPELVAPCTRHMHQASLSLALAETGIPIGELPEAMNYQLNATHVEPPPGFADIDPVILHYHHLATDDGFLLPAPYPKAQARIEQFHERMRAEGVVQEAAPQAMATESRPVVILGMHRSGTSVVTQLIAAFGLYAGQPDEITPPDMFNPTGYWELKAIVDLDREMLESHARGRPDALTGNLVHLSSEQRADFVARARMIAESLRGRGPFVLKDPRMAVLFPLWREVLEKPICVIVWRDPFAVARSIHTRDRQPLELSVALWEHYNRSLLRDSEGLPRVLISYEELLAEPMRVARDLHAKLVECGIECSMPSEERVRQIVKGDFNRSGRKAEEVPLDADQRTLLGALRSGEVLHRPVEPTSYAKRSLFARIHELHELREYASDLEQLLDATFSSRSWRVGHTLTAMLRRGKAVTAPERWRQTRQRRPR